MSGRGSHERERHIDPVEDAIAQYLDRLDAGETVEPAAVLAENPEIGTEVLESLEDFLDLGHSQRGAGRLAARTLGDYTLSRPLGRGGMGVVYEAWENSMDRRVAVKVLPAALAADTRRVARFVREAQVAGKIQHPNVVPVYSTGVREGVPYYAMELVEGETLAQFIARQWSTGNDSEAAAMEPGLQLYARLAQDFAAVAGGLHHAHSKGVIHRDIKPSNLIFRGIFETSGPSEARHGRLRILDFGLARLSGDETLTVSGDFIGTPLYMSPEQARRRRVRIDHRTDIYSLGAAMYEACTGRPPFQGKDHDEILSSILESDPLELRQLRPSVPADLQTVVLKCLRKDPNDRYRSAEALAQDLQRFARGDAIEARPQSRWERTARRFTRARRKIALAAVVGALAGTALWMAAGRRSAEREALEASYGRRLPEAVVKLLAGRFSVEEAPSAKVGPVVGRRDARGIFTEGTRVTPFRVADVQAFFSRDGMSSIHAALHSLEQLATGLPQKRDARYHLARAYQLLDDTASARREAEATLGIDPAFTPARTLLWELNGEPGGIDGPALEDILERARRDDDSTTTTDRWRAEWVRGYRSWNTNNWTEAADSYHELLTLSDAPYVGSELEAYLRLGVAQLEQKQPARAQASFSVARYLVGGVEPTVLLAKAYHLDGKEELAEETLTALHAEARAHAASGASSGGEAVSPDGVAVLAAAVYHTLGNHERGLAWSGKVLDIAWKARLEAYFFWRLGRTQKAIAAADRAVERHPRDPVALLSAGHALRDDLWRRPRDGRSYAQDLGKLVDIAERAVGLAETTEFAATNLLRSAQELVAHTLPSDLQEKLRSDSMESRMSHSTDVVQSSERNVRRQIVTLMAVTAGIGLIGSAAGQDIEVGPHQGRFVNVRPVAELNTFDVDWAPSLTEDGLLLVFSRGPVAGQLNLWMAEREDRHGAFGPPIPLDTLNAIGGAANGRISPDGLKIVFATRAIGSGDIYYAEREHREDDFGEPQPLGDRINTSLDEEPGWLSPDGLLLYFSRSRRQPGEIFSHSGDLFVAKRPNDGVWWDSPEVTVEPIADCNTELYGEIVPSVSSDGEVLFFGEWLTVNPAGPGGADTWFAVRNGPGAADFGSPAPFTFPVNIGADNGHDMSPWITYDWPAPGSELWFTRCGNTPNCSQTDIWVATWVSVPDEDTFLRGDCDGDGTASGVVTDAVFLLNFNFVGGPAPPCLAACDADGSGDVRGVVTDAIYLLNFNFLGGPPPVEPFPACGPGLLPSDEGSCEVAPLHCQR